MLKRFFILSSLFMVSCAHVLHDYSIICKKEQMMLVVPGCMMVEEDKDTYKLSCLTRDGNEEMLYLKKDQKWCSVGKI